MSINRGILKLCFILNVALPLLTGKIPVIYLQKKKNYSEQGGKVVEQNVFLIIAHMFSSGRRQTPLL